MIEFDPKFVCSAAENSYRVQKKVCHFQVSLLAILDPLLPVNGVAMTQNIHWAPERAYPLRAKLVRASIPAIPVIWDSFLPSSKSLDN
jgi:hypothetical protein